MTDARYIEEFDMLVNDLTDGYVNDELSSEDRSRVAEYFLVSEDRQKKLRFTFALREEKLRRKRQH